MFFYRTLSFLRHVIIRPLECSNQTRCYSVPGVAGKIKKIGKKGPAIEKKVLDVETDVDKLLKYCCGTNILKEGGQDVELKPDSEYPDWLWTIRTGPAPPLEELDPNTKVYWRRLRREGLKRNNMLNKLKPF
ncbi:39S ribosomal protein L54, mitochondrial [Copidosoma floridanum]|uniref:39S ribosomal protein L54, mitochondrial n=1 Tax=Copidosoma floridanum TaxID=29053 RepID=UPI0006C9857D|nr:39S ribosomal protein L54, mitochondrial [Copidosoma floridanum]